MAWIPSNEFLARFATDSNDTPPRILSSGGESDSPSLSAPISKDQALVENTKDDVVLLVNEMREHGASQKELADFLGYSRHVICRICAKLKSGWYEKETTTGRPLSINKEQEQLLLAAVQTGAKSKKLVTRKQFRELQLNAMSETAKAAGKNDLQTSLRVSRNTEARLKQRLGISFVKPQQTTKARAKAGADLRNNLTLAAMHAAFSALLSFHLIMNMDASTFRVQFSTNDRVCRVARCKDAATITETDEMDVFQKILFVANAHGGLAPPLFVIADGSLSAEQCIILTVPGLNFNYTGAAPGYIAVCRTRSGNDASFKFAYTTFLPSFVRECRTLANSTESSAYVTQDGEAIQHRPLDEDEVLKMLETERIDVGKGPASCSIVGNALDASKLFLTIKTALKQGEAVGEAPSFDSELEDRIVLTLGHEQLDISKAKRGKIAAGAVHILHAMKEVIKPHIIQDGFRSIGLIATGANEAEVALKKLKKTLSCCSTWPQIPQSQIDLIWQQWPAMVDLFGKHGQITDADFDEMKILAELDENGDEKIHHEQVDKAELPLHRQRAVLVTHRASVARRNAYNERKEAAEAEAAKKRKLAAGKKAANALKKKNSVNKQNKVKNELEEPETSQGKKRARDEIESSKEMKRRSTGGKQWAVLKSSPQSMTLIKVCDEESAVDALNRWAIQQDEKEREQEE
jgi:hypothetical protein